MIPAAKSDGRSRRSVLRIRLAVCTGYELGRFADDDRFLGRPRRDHDSSRLFPPRQKFNVCNGFEVALSAEPEMSSCPKDGCGEL